MGVILTKDQKRRLRYDKFYALSLEEDSDEYSKDDIDDFYAVEPEKRCDKFQADIDYYGVYSE